MSEVISKKDKLINTGLKPQKIGGSTSYGRNQTNPIYNYNGYIPTYQSPYYTTNCNYQMPQVYTQYPTSHLTNPQVNTAKKITPGATIDAGGTKCEIPPGTSGLNIIINSPTVATPGSQPMINTNTNCSGGCANANANATANSNTNNKPQKTKNIVAITNNYIKNLENYLRNPDNELKAYAMNELAKRFEEDETRKTNPSLNALLNLGLQAQSPKVRLIALSILNAGLAGGNDVTVQLLNNMQQSTVHKGEEAKDAKRALLKLSETIAKVPDNSPEKIVYVKEEDKK